MQYKKHNIKAGKPIKTPKGKKKGVLDVTDKDGNLVNFFTYTVRNYLSLSSARKKAKDWIDGRK